MAFPARSYFVCTTPRSGSTLLSEALLSTEVAGRPREYFQELPSTLRQATPRDYVGLVPDPVVRDVLSAPGADRHADNADWSVRHSTWAEYLDTVVVDGTTANGVFAAKVMWRYFGGLLLRLRETFGGGDDLDLLERAFGTPRFVFLRREDKISQAVSLWRAIQSWSWRAGDEGSTTTVPVYSFAAIDHLVRRLELDEADWERWFRTVGVQPYGLEYTSVADDYAGAARGVLDFVSCHEPVLFDRTPPLRRQGDALSEEWSAQYQLELTRGGEPSRGDPASTVL